MGNDVELGFQSALYVNTGTYASPTWTEIDLARDVESLGEVAKIDATTRRTARNRYTANVAGLREIGWRIPTLIPAAGESNAAYSALLASFEDGTTVDILHVEGGVISTDGLDATRAVCRIFGGAKSEPLNDVSSRDFEASFTLNDDQDVPQYGTTSGGEFVPSS
jgi:hypothetical protein